jgi:hypothetical protein
VQTEARSLAGDSHSFDSPGQNEMGIVSYSLYKNGYPCISGLMIPGTKWEPYCLIAGSRSRARVLGVLLTEAFFQSIPGLNEVFATIEKGDIYIIPIRVDDSGDSDISRDKERMWPTGVVGDNVSFDLKRFTVVEKLAGLNALPERGTLLSARDHTLN